MNEKECKRLRRQVRWSLRKKNKTERDTEYEYNMEGYKATGKLIYTLLLTKKCGRYAYKLLKKATKL